MRRVARRLMGTRLRRPYDSQDLVQATLAGVLEDIRSREFRSTQHRRGFLRKAMRNRALAMGRKETHGRLSDVDLDGCHGREESPSVLARRADDQVHLNGLLRELPKADLEILRLVHVERCSYEQVAESLGIRVEAARQRYSRAIGKLRDLAGE